MFKHQQSRRALLHTCYEATRKAAETFNPYADPQEIAMVAEAMADKMEAYLTSPQRGKTLVEFTASDADNYDYLCAILDEVHKTIPVTQFFNVKLHLERVQIEEIKDAATAVDSHHGGEAQDLE